MSERAILKTLIVYLLIGCFLVSNVSCAYASSEASADSYKNKTEVSEEEQPSEEAQNSEENLESSEEQSQSSEDTDTQSSGNEENESEGTQPPENTKTAPDKEAETNLSENKETEPDDETEINLSENKEIESDDETDINSSKDTGIKPAEKTETNLSENKETVSSKNSENQSSGDTEVENEGTENQTSGEMRVAEDTEIDSSHHTGNSYHIEHSEYTIVENNTYVQSEPVKKEALESSGSTENSKSAAPPSASVNLHGEKTRVVSGEDILLKLSAVNLITKPVMHVQVIIIPPSGMSVSSSEFVQSGAGQYTTTYELEPGQGRDIEVRIETNQPGDFNVEGRVVYYFGEDTGNAEDYTLNLPIKVETKSNPVEEALPGFRLTSLVFVLIAVFILKRH